MKNILIAFFLIASTVFRTVQAQTHFHFTPLYNRDKADLLKQLKAAKTDTEKLNLLNDLVFYYPLVESPEDIDTVYLNQLISLNQSAGLVDDRPYQTLRQGAKGWQKK